MKKTYIFTAILFAVSVTLSSAQVKVEKSPTETKKATITKVQKEKSPVQKSSTAPSVANTSKKGLKNIEANEPALDIESLNASQKKELANIEAKRKENEKKSAEARAARDKKTAALQKRLEKRNAKNNN
jgi:LAS superfamily LD-carboxypeptidase LdcB